LKLNKALNILDSDVRPIVLLGALHFVVAAAHALFDIGSTSLLIANLGADVLPEVYIGSALLLISVGFFFIPMVDRLDRVRLFTITLAFFALVLAITHHLGERAPDLIYRGLYLLCYLMKGLVFLQYWLIAGEVADLRQAKRIFPILLGFSLTGGLAASLAASVLPRWLPTEDLLLVAAILLAAGLIPTRVVARRYRERLQHPGLPVPFHVSDIWTQVRSDLKISLSSRLLRNLSLSTLLFALLAQFMDFFMGKAASLHYVDATGIVETGALTAFYAALNASVIGVGAVLQFLVANRLISSVGVTRGQITGSLAFLAGFGAIAVSLIVTGNGLGLAFFYAVLASRALQKVLRISIYRSSIDLIYNPIPSERRGRAKAFKETVIEPVGVLLGGLLLIIGGLFDAKVLVLAALALSVLFFFFSLRLKNHYLESLVAVLQEKSRFRFAFPSSVVRPAQRKKEPEGVVSDLERALDDNAVSVRLLAVELAAELREPAAAPLLVRHFSQEPDPKVRATMVAALGKLLRRKQESLSAVEPSLEDQDARVRANGIDALAQIGITESSSFLAPFVHDPEPRIRANTAVAYTRLDPERGADEARQILLDMYESGEESPQLSALFGLGEVGDEKSVEVLGSAMNDDRISVRHRAILGLAQAGRREGIDKLLVFLEEGDGATRHVAARALESCGEAAIDPLILALWGSEVGVRQYVSRALGHIGAPRARQALIHILSLEAEGAYYDLLRLEKIGELPQTSGIVLLADSLTERVRQAKANALQVLQLAFGDQKGMRLILSNLIHPEPYVRSSAIEALEVRVDQSLLGGVQPLFEHSNPRVTAEHGGVLYQLPSKEPLEVLMELASDRSRWIRACAIYAMGEAADKKVLPLLERRVKDPYELARLNAIEAIGRLAETSSLALLEQIRKEQEGRVRQYADLAIREIQARSGSSAG
jgi:HEAT repeat protein/ATP/ADP translocase